MVHLDKIIVSNRSALLKKSPRSKNSGASKPPSRT